MTPNEIKSNRIQTKQNKTNYVIQYNTLHCNIYNTIQYNTIQYNTRDTMIQIEREREKKTKQ